MSGTLRRPGLLPVYDDRCHLRFVRYLPVGKLGKPQVFAEKMGDLALVAPKFRQVFRAALQNEFVMRRKGQHRIGNCLSNVSSYVWATCRRLDRGDV